VSSQGTSTSSVAFEEVKCGESTMRTKKESSIDRMLRAARKSNPELWERTEQVARIVSPEAFEEWTLIEPDSARRLHVLRMRLVKATAMRKAQDVLAFLGVNTEADWFDILSKMTEGSSDQQADPDIQPESLSEA
jgi:hypothetical protein